MKIRDRLEFYRKEVFDFSGSNVFWFNDTKESNTIGLVISPMEKPFFVNWIDNSPVEYYDPEFEDLIEYAEGFKNGD